MSEESFTSKFLKDCEKRANEAQEKAQERLRSAAAKRKLREQAKEEIEKARLNAEVEEILARSKSKTSLKGKRVKKKAPETSCTTNGHQTPQNAAASHPQTANGYRINYRAPPKVHTSRPPGKLRRNMEYVVRRPRERKEIQVPHTSDYSDMYGEDFWMGIDLDFAKKSAKETAEATAANKKIIAEQQAEREKRKLERDEFLREEQELERKGLLDEKSKYARRLKFSEKDWASVEVPIPISLQKSSAVAKLAQKGTSKSDKASAMRKANMTAPAAERIEKRETRSQVKERARLFAERMRSLDTPMINQTSKGEGRRKVCIAQREAVNRESSLKEKSMRKDQQGNKDYFSHGQEGEKKRVAQGQKEMKKPRTRLSKRLRDFGDASDGSSQTSRSPRHGNRKRRRRCEEQNSCESADHFSKGQEGEKRRMTRGQKGRKDPITRLSKGKDHFSQGQQGGEKRVAQRQKGMEKPITRRSKRLRDFADESDGSRQTSRRPKHRDTKRRRCSEKQNSYDSENSAKEETDGCEDESDDDDLYDISAIDREEARSARIARMEDRRELGRTLRHKREKARRRREFERDTV